MKTLFLSLTMSTALFFSISLPAFAETPTEASVRELLDKTKAGEAAVQMVNQMMPSMKMMAPGAPQSFWDEIEKEFNAESFIKLVIPIYQKHLTQEDINAINAFYDTPAGKHLIEKQGVIMQESMIAGQQWGEQVAGEVIKRVGEQK